MERTASTLQRSESRLTQLHGNTMTASAFSLPTARTFTVVDLVDAAHTGRLRIPSFQRPLRWGGEDVHRLFDSIVKGYPIGNLLLWKRPADREMLVLGRLTIDAPQLDEAWWVVDGQQRLTSLANAVSAAGSRDERFRWSFDLRKNDFVAPPREEDGHIVPLPVLFNLEELIRWFSKEHPEASNSLDRAAAVTRALREFQIPAYLVDQKDEGILREIFDRLNGYGKRLSRAEIFAALHGNSDTPPFDRIAEEIQDHRAFGLLDGDTVMRAVLARRGGDVTRDIRIEFSSRAQQSRDFAHESPEAAYHEGERALLRAVEFLQEDAGVPHFAFLAYRYLLVVLTRFFAHYPNPDPRNRVLLRRWYWRAATIGPGVFSTSWTQAMRTLATRIEPGDETGAVQQLLAPPIERRLHMPPLAGFRSTNASTRIIACALWAMMPRAITTGKRYNRSQLSEALGSEDTLTAIAPRIIRREPASHRGSAVNRLLFLDEQSEPMVRLLTTVPERLATEADSVLASHGFGRDTIGLLAEGDMAQFFDRRTAELTDALRTFLERMTETAFEDTPPLSAFDLDDVGEERDDAIRG